ncbi:hypothetical protein TCSYLVIO_002400 [Trypanosoma cruzi]|nr:hypothetical protein TCSYLVIO_002400 [Trypanosoma cruzi]
MDFGLANCPTQATRVTHRNVSSPDVTAYCALRISHWTFAPYMDSDHCLISCLVKMVDGIPRLANTLPRRKKATFALRKADWPAFSHRCVKLSLPPRPHCWTSAEVSYEQLSAISRLAAVTAPKRYGHTKWNKPRSLMKQHTKHTHCLTWRQATLSRIYPKKEGTKIKPCAVAPQCFWKPARKDLEPHPARAGDIFTAWRCRILILWNRLCSALILAAFAPCLGNRQTCLFVILCGFTCHTALCCCCCCSLRSLVPGGWEMDRPLTPYELVVAIRDSSLGSAPGPDNMLNEFLHRLGPVARGTLRTMIHNSFANGSLPEDSMSGSDDGDSPSPSQVDIS